MSWGAIAGGMSLLVLPRSLITSSNLKLANLALTPVAVGLMMMMLGRFRAKNAQALVQLDRFGYAFTFALSMALIRYFCAT
jgi:hypothetical protein